MSYTVVCWCVISLLNSKDTSFVVCTYFYGTLAITSVIIKILSTHHIDFFMKIKFSDYSVCMLVLVLITIS